MGSTFAEAFESEFPQLHRYLRRRAGPDLADELAAETFATAYANWGRYDTGRSLRPWLYGIAANLLRHHWRSERRQLRAYARTGIDVVVDDTDDSLSRADGNVQRRQLAAALADLRRDDKEILLLHAWAELTDAQIAEALSIPVGTVKSRLHRLRAQLRNRLEGTGQETNDQRVNAEWEIS
jgi:RNA polymerase sigma factor (sigma-70 family)